MKGRSMFCVHTEPRVSASEPQIAFLSQLALEQKKTYKSRLCNVILHLIIQFLYMNIYKLQNVFYFFIFVLFVCAIAYNLFICYYWLFVFSWNREL